jgi:hypothetical protein
MPRIQVVVIHVGELAELSRLPNPDPALNLYALAKWIVLQPYEIEVRVWSGGDSAEPSHDNLAIADFEAEDEPANQWTIHRVTIPRGFLSDGSSFSIDFSTQNIHATPGFLAHDWLYGTHCFDDRTDCPKDLADQVLELLMKMNISVDILGDAYHLAVELFAKYAWDKSHSAFLDGRRVLPAESIDLLYTAPPEKSCCTVL